MGSCLLAIAKDPCSFQEDVKQGLKKDVAMLESLQKEWLEHLHNCSNL